MTAAAMEIITNKLFDQQQQQPSSVTAATTTTTTSEQIKNFLNHMNKSLNSSLSSLTNSLKSSSRQHLNKSPLRSGGGGGASSSSTTNLDHEDDLDDTSVRVALRVRPQLARERIEMCKICTYVTPNEPQVTLGHDKAFTYDYVFDIQSKQEYIFNKCVKSLIDGCLNGYNATVLAYGQTGSGKTYTMGTSFDINLLPEDDGIIPRAVGYLFKQINERMKNCSGSIKPTFEVIAQFMELYNEEIIDLFDVSRNQAAIATTLAPTTTTTNTNKSNKIEIHEDSNGNVYVNGCTSRIVSCAADTLELLKTGARIRTTASTNMNLTSSRSHAIFTLHIKQTRIIREGVETINNTDDIETLTAKFHFVDLAGSERLKRTGAIGERAKEGICINRGLLSLGNVISALGDIEKKGSHVPYRDSKLTRLLQDSLGGNSRTMMIACVSSSDSDFMETLNTLRYANRARNIKNKIVINQDKTSKQIALLRAEIQKLQLELMEYKSGKKLIQQSIKTDTLATVTCDIESTMKLDSPNDANNILVYYDGNKITIEDLKQENYLIKNENNSLKIRCKAMQETIDNLREKNVKLQTNLDLLKLNRSTTTGGDNNTELCTDTNLIENYIKQIEELRCKLIESESICKQLRNSKSTAIKTSTIFSNSKMATTTTTADNYDSDSSRFEINDDNSAVEQLIDEAKKDIEKHKQLAQSKLVSRTRSATTGSGGSGEVAITVEQQQQLLSSSSLSTSSLTQSFNEKLLKTSTENQANEEIEIQEDLTSLNVEIDLKERLISELEERKNQIHQMKFYYEEKLDVLNERMHKLETERDGIIDSYSKLNQSLANDEKIKKVKLEFECKLKNLGQEIQKYTNLKQKHQQMVKQSQENEKQIEQLNRELVEMKKMKIKLIKQLKFETNKYKSDERNYQKEIQSLRRDHAKKESQIRTLNEENKKKCVILKRKQEQIQALSKQQRQVYTSTTTKTTRMSSSLVVSSASSTSSYAQKLNLYKWQNIENNIQAIITKKQTICLIERDMERYMEQREKIGRKLNRLQKRLERAHQETSLDEAEKQQQKSKMDDLQEQIDIMKSNVDYIQDQISECQANIIVLDESKDANDMLTAQNLITSINSIDEAKYLVEKFYNLALNKGVVAAQKEYLNKELEIELSQFERDHYVQQQILQQLMASDSTDSANQDYEIDEIILAPQMQDSSDSDSNNSRDSSPIRPISKLLSGTRVLSVINNDESPPPQQETQSPTRQINNNNNNEKTRSKIPNGLDELLYSSLPVQQQQPQQECNLALKRVLSQSYTKLAPNSKTGAPPVIDTDTDAGSLSPTHNQDMMAIDRARPRTKTMSRQTSKDSLISTSPNSSPNPKRTLRDENVFNRLTSETKQAPMPEQGNIKAYVGSNTRFRLSPIFCTHVAEGHSKAVLSVDSYDGRLYTGSKDRTAKIWDLHTGQEILSLVGHPNNVSKIRYCPHTNLVFTVSASYVKIWDIREAPSTCVKTLSSSGLVIDGDFNIYKSNRTLLNELPSGEHPINDIAVEKYGNKFYTAAGNSVKIWDLKQFLPIGRLSGGHNSTIMTLALDDVDYDNNVLITGSKDHYIKMFDINNGVGVIPARRSFSPPHYDGVQTLAIVGDTLFSGSRDMCIKKWDLIDYKCKQSLNNAHKDWICALDYLSDQNVLISACRAGYLKFWNIETCEKITEFRAHFSPINSIKIENNFVFTASDDTTVRIWKRNPNY